VLTRPTPTVNLTPRSTTRGTASGNRDAAMHGGYAQVATAWGELLVEIAHTGRRLRREELETLRATGPPPRAGGWPN
jgi:hypothetical protein